MVTVWAVDHWVVLKRSEEAVRGWSEPMTGVTLTSWVGATVSLTV